MHALVAGAFRTPPPERVASYSSGRSSNEAAFLLQQLLLPVRNRFERPHRTTVESGNNWVRLNEPGRSHLRSGLLISEVAFLSRLAKESHGSDTIDVHRLCEPVYVRELIARTVVEQPGTLAVGDPVRGTTAVASACHWL